VPRSAEFTKQPAALPARRLVQNDCESQFFQDAAPAPKRVARILLTRSGYTVLEAAAGADLDTICLESLFRPWFSSIFRRPSHCVQQRFDSIRIQFRKTAADAGGHKETVGHVEVIGNILGCGESMAIGPTFNKSL
jgi:hypothetical protein